MTWAAAYRDTLARLDADVSHARLTLCGFSSCVDATVSLHDAVARFASPLAAEAERFARMLLERACAGVGGEIRVDWPGGPAWLDRNIAFRLDMGGTGPHVARALSALGAPALLALRARSPEQLGVLDPRISLADGGRAVPAGSVAASQPNAPKTYIFEFTKGRPLGARTPPRSSRIIVRFADSGLESDRDFESLSCRRAGEAGAAVLSGFNTVAIDQLEAVLARTRELVTRWRAAGIPTIHLELAGYARPENLDQTLSALTGSITSLGMSFSEFRALVSNPDLASGMRALGDRLQVRRVCVHADDWAAAATLDDPERERAALLTGSLLASTRAARGRSVFPRELPAGAVFGEPPALPDALGRWQLVACATPYLAHPVTTLGLGDTFVAGCLLVLGGQGSQPSISSQPEPHAARSAGNKRCCV